MSILATCSEANEYKNIKEHNQTQGQCVVRYLSCRERLGGPTKNELDKATSMILSKKAKEIFSGLQQTSTIPLGVDTMMK